MKRGRPRLAVNIPDGPKITREEVNNAIENFLKKGGKITEIESQEAPLKFAKYNTIRHDQINQEVT